MKDLIDYSRETGTGPMGKHRSSFFGHFYVQDIANLVEGAHYSNLECGFKSYITNQGQGKTPTTPL